MAVRPGGGYKFRGLGKRELRELAGAGEGRTGVRAQVTGQVAMLPFFPSRQKLIVSLINSRKILCTNYIINQRGDAAVQQLLKKRLSLAL